jgi:hypothetical protein
MGSIVSFGNLNKGANGNFSLPKSDPLDSVLGKEIVIENVEIKELKGGRSPEIAIIYTEGGAVFRSSGKVILSSLKEVIIPELEKGNKVRVKPVRTTFKNGNRGMIFES